MVEPILGILNMKQHGGGFDEHIYQMGVSTTNYRHIPLRTQPLNKTSTANIKYSTP